MKTIKTLADLQQLKAQNVLPKSSIEFIEEEFRMLMEAYQQHETHEQFSLERHGFLVILENGNDVMSLSEVGLSSELGVFGIIPEYVEKYEFGDSALYKVGILYDNDFMMLLYIPDGIENGELLDWLEHWMR